MTRLFAHFRHWLFDFSAGEEQNRRTAAALRALLEETTTDAEFQARLRGKVLGPDGLASERNWIRVQRRLYQYQKAGERDDEFRVWGERYWSDLTRLYGNDNSK